jgi:very-short-patch-repair endonuclease/uncharacterized protein YukE
MNGEIATKGIALLSFLRDAAKLRRVRVAAYESGAKILWVEDVPTDQPECRTVFTSDHPDEFADHWIEVRKKRMPSRPPVPKVAVDWVRPQDLDQTDTEPELLREITVLVETPLPEPEVPPVEQGSSVQSVPELRRLEDHADVQEAWLEYVLNRWQPWAQEMRRWQEVQDVYEDVDFMRRRLEETEERYELILGLGLVQWRDSTGTTVKRHLLTAPAEIVLEAARGVLRVVPSASFDSFRVELDMLERQDQPRLQGEGLEDKLGDLDIRAWDTAKVGEILRVIANRATAGAEVDETCLAPPDRADDTFRVFYAPALVLRERRPTSYDKLIAGFLDGTQGDWANAVTKPFEQLLLEGQPRQDPVGGETGQPDPAIGPGGLADRLLFPLPTNEAQREIANRLQARPYVLVKGPPGTGKSLTIANLICHLLAHGERVLVTAHAPKALNVLRGLLPPEFQHLCVTTLGASREDQELLKEGVNRILQRRNEWRGEEWAQDAIDKLEHELQQLVGELAEVERALRECREAETHSHSLPGEYQGTAGQIARRLEQERERFAWFPKLPKDPTPFPLDAEEIGFLAGVNAELTEDRVRELDLEMGDFVLPAPDAFREMASAYATAKRTAERMAADASQERTSLLGDCSADTLAALQSSFSALEDAAARAGHALGDLAERVLKDLLMGQEERWSNLSRELNSLRTAAVAEAERAGTARIDLPPAADPDRLRTDAERRLKHFEDGGHRGFSVFAPRAVIDTRYLERSCCVDGRAPREPDSLRKLVGFLRLAWLVDRLVRQWPAPVLADHAEPTQILCDLSHLAEELQQLLGCFATLRRDALACVPVGDRVALAQRGERVKWISAIAAEVARRAERDAAEPLYDCLRALRGCAETGRAHPTTQRLAHAVTSGHVGEWQVAWQERERVRIAKEALRRYQALLTTLDEGCPGLADSIRERAGQPDWKEKFLELDKAWAWAYASAWVQSLADSDRYRELVQSSHRLQTNIEDKTKDVAAARAWRAFFERADDATFQNLNAWTQAQTRIRGGTGVQAYRHRRAARGYLMPCIPKIPAWIMPLHKLWETVEAQPGLFDTVIVDEASQAGLESLALFLLAKRIVVVGDDKQNSPEAVGVEEADIDRLGREHLMEFGFRAEFRPDTSLFDHSARAFGHPISLREHFRCVPEIIRFSNDLCYRDAPLIPLRQAPPNRLPPLQYQYVSEGFCDGEGSRIHNDAEAEAVVEAVSACLQDKAYEGKTMGVIALQGHAQAELIGAKLAKTLDPRVFEERRLRCGVPATFQGDQRDVIFLSLVVAPNHRYKALNQLPDQRRFNVAMSRARDQVWLFHSVQIHDLSPQCLRYRLLRFFQNPRAEAVERVNETLDRLEREVRLTARRPGNQPRPYESWFEVDVALELLRRKYTVRPQYEVAGRRIDLVVEGLDAQLAVECDGDFWHGPERYEADRIRERVLRDAGWVFVRIRESEFYADRSGSVQQIIAACDELGIRPVDYVDQADWQQPVPEASTPSATVAGRAEAASDSDITNNEISLTETADAEYGPFTSYSKESALPDPRDASAANVREALRTIIREDGPLLRASVLRLYVEGCPELRRAGKVVRQTLNRALGALLRSAEIVQEDEMGEGSVDGYIVRLAGAPRVQERLAGRRDLLEIPPSELHVVLDRLHPSSRTPGDEQVVYRALLDHYGYTRLTSLRRRYLRKVLELWRPTESEAERATAAHEQAAGHQLSREGAMQLTSEARGTPA